MFSLFCKMEYWVKNWCESWAAIFRQMISILQFLQHSKIHFIGSKEFRDQKEEFNCSLFPIKKFTLSQNNGIVEVTKLEPIVFFETGFHLFAITLKVIVLKRGLSKSLFVYFNSFHNQITNFNYINWKSTDIWLGIWTHGHRIVSADGP